MMSFFKHKLTPHHVLSLDASKQKGIRYFALLGLQVLLACSRDLKDGQLSLRAMSLVYTTLITLVPLLALSFSVLKGFGVHNQLEPFLLNFLQGLGPEKSIEITEKVIGFVDNIKVGVLGALGLGLLIYAVIALMQKIESAFNMIWRVGQSRTIAERFSDYLSVLIFGPLFLFISAGITSGFNNIASTHPFITNTGLDTIFQISGFLIPWIIMAFGVTFIFVYMPNTKVKIGPAFTGALVTAFMWKAVSFIFATFIQGSANYVAIYAAFATLIILMIWLYTVWLIILMGANVSFYLQNPRYLALARKALIPTPREQILLGLVIMDHITQNWYKRGSGLSFETLLDKTQAPAALLDKCLRTLENGHVLLLAGPETPQYVPARPLEELSAEELIEILENPAKDALQGLKITPNTHKALKEILDARQTKLSKHSVANLFKAKK